ncbi:MAG TPA: PLP-dependent transferase, partial [Chloroflexota bacterium]|nr:PLP-dependent transferase [Chloroflexota bacterium]
MRFDTSLVHQEGDNDPDTGAVSVPIYQASTFNQPDLENPTPFDYSRSGNPTRAALEGAIASMEGGVAGFAFASGMAA